MDQPPPDLYGPSEGPKDANRKAILNACKRENYQRNALYDGINDAEPNDIVMISDLDEIPQLESICFSSIREKIILFRQIYCYYKLNWQLPNTPWYGSRACKKKNLKSPQWLRNIKSKRYHPLLRPDTWFKNNRYYDIKIIKDGGWHFAYAKTAEAIKYKLVSYLHCIDFDNKAISVGKLDEYIKDKKPIYDLSVDQRQDKTASSSQLQIIPHHALPQHIRENQTKYQDLIATEDQ